MDLIATTALSFASGALLFQYASCGIAALRFAAGRHQSGPGVLTGDAPAISVVRPLRGLEAFSEATLRSTFHIDYPRYEILFCVADADDPVLPLLRTVMADYPESEARILTGNDAISANPKLNNMAKGFRAARHGFIVFVDSNVYTPPDYLAQLADAAARGAGMVSAPPVGLAPQGFWAEVECAFLNSYQARLQYSADALGFAFAQGKTLFFRREDLEHGGFARLALEPAEDAAATKLIRATGRSVRLAGPFPQLIGPRAALRVWSRQVRWARLRRASFPAFFAPEALAGSLPPLLAVLAGADLIGLDPVSAAAVFLAIWYAPELLLARAAHWPRSLAAIGMRDLLLPFVFLWGCAGNSFEWHGQRMTAGAAGEAGSTRLRRRDRIVNSRLVKLATRALHR